MTASPSFALIRAQVAAISKKVPNAAAIGLRCAGRWAGEPTRSDGESTYLIRQCDSPLAARLALREPAPDGAVRVLLTRLDDRDLGDDVLMRLAKRSLIPVDPWRIVPSLFQAHDVDPRLAAHGWIADALFESLPPGGYPPAPGGFLDAETVWPLLLSRRLGLTADPPDLIALLAWSAEAGAASRYRAAPAEFREAAAEWLAERAGPAARPVLRYLEASGEPDAVAVGLAAGVVFHPEAEGRLEKAAGRFEATYLAGGAAEPALLARWAAAAEAVVRSAALDPKARRRQLARGDEILREVGAEAFAYLSDVSPLGFDRRLERLAGLIDDSLCSPAAAAGEPLRSARAAVAAHDEARREGLRLERVEMALRLVRRLAVSVAPPASFAEAAERHLRDGGFADWARFLLRSPEPVRALADAYARLFEAATADREREAEWFAALLRDWTAAGCAGNGVVPVERILDEVVAPLAGAAPVLLVVVDGMSVAVCRELLADLTGRGWACLAEPGRGRLRPGIAMAPSVTEHSRASLLCGRPTTGDARREREGFESHAGLRAKCKSGHPPVLFHKATLEGADESILNPEVRRAIESPSKRVVGVVVNAVDDHLFKGGQLEVRWSRDAVRVLPPLLHEARDAGRAVVLVADHGHVLEAGSKERPFEGGERWRVDDGKPSADEVRLEGTRVLAGGGRLIAPWSERVRYVGKRNGYHGGASPQEMVVPVAVLWVAESPPDGWTELPPDAPEWWDEPVEVAAAPTSEVPAPPAPPKPRKTLFDDEPVAPAAPTPAVARQTSLPDWLVRFLGSESFASQRRLAGRAAPPDELLGRLLAALDARGGKLTSAGLSKAVGVPPLRMRGLLASAQRVLNVDGYPVLSRDDADDTVTFDRGLLAKQFGLGT